MGTLLIIIGTLAIAAGVGYVLIKKGKIKDSDGDFIPDVVEDKVDEVKGKVQKKVKAVKTRVKNVKDEIEDVVEEIEDIFQAIKGKVTKSKLNSLTKKKLVEAAKKDHNCDLDISVNKSVLVNKVYSLYNKK